MLALGYWTLVFGLSPKCFGFTADGLAFFRFFGLEVRVRGFGVQLCVSKGAWTSKLW